MTVPSLPILSLKYLLGQLKEGWSKNVFTYIAQLALLKQGTILEASWQATAEAGLPIPPDVSW